MNVPIDEDAWGKLDNVRFLKSGEEYHFMVAGETQIIKAKSMDGQLDLVPERSVLHKTLQVALGVR